MSKLIGKNVSWFFLIWHIISFHLKNKMISLMKTSSRWDSCRMMLQRTLGRLLKNPNILFSKINKLSFVFGNLDCILYNSCLPIVFLMKIGKCWKTFKTGFKTLVGKEAIQESIKNVLWTTRDTVKCQPKKNNKKWLV